MSLLWKPSYSAQKKQIDIPQQYLNNYCILAIDQKHARLFTFHHQRLKEKESFFAPLAQDSDKQGYFVVGSSTGGNPEKHDRQRSKTKHYCQYVIHKTMQVMSQENLKYLIILVAKKVHAMFKSEMQNIASGNHYVIQTGEFVKEPLETIEKKTKQIISEKLEPEE